MEAPAWSGALCAHVREVGPLKACCGKDPQDGCVFHDSEHLALLRAKDVKKEKRKGKECMQASRNRLIKSSHGWLMQTDGVLLMQVQKHHRH